MSGDRYPLAALIGYVLMPTGAGNGVMAVCERHEGAVSALAVNSLSEAPTLANLAYMAAEHEAEHHDGPALPGPDHTSLPELDGDQRYRQGALDAAAAVARAVLAFDHGSVSAEAARVCYRAALTVADPQPRADLAEQEE